MTPHFEDHVYAWSGRFVVDADGAPNAYAPSGSGLLGLDYLANAGTPGDWYGLATVQGVPVIQAHDDPRPGYYVSTTSLVDHSFRTTDPRRYVDSTKVPYIAVPHELRYDGVLLGDVAMVLYGSKRCGAVVADVCPAGHYGEGSIALAKILGIPESAKHGGVDKGVSFAVFKHSSHGWPREPLDFAGQAMALFKQWGDVPRLSRVLGG